MVDDTKEALNDIRLINFEGMNGHCNEGRSRSCFRFLKKHREAIFNALHRKNVDVDCLKKECAANYKKLMLKDLTTEEWYGVRFAIDHLHAKGCLNTPSQKTE